MVGQNWGNFTKLLCLFFILGFFWNSVDAACTATTCSECVKDIKCAWCVFAPTNGTVSSSTTLGCVDGTYKGENNEGQCSEFFWMQCTIPGFTFKTRYTYLILFLLCVVVFLVLVVGIIILIVYSCKQRRRKGHSKKRRQEQSDLPDIENTELQNLRNKRDQENASIASLEKRSASVARRSNSVSAESPPSKLHNESEDGSGKGLVGSDHLDRSTKEHEKTQKRDAISSSASISNLIKEITGDDMKPPTPPLPRLNNNNTTTATATATYVPPADPESESESTPSSTSSSASTKPPTPPDSQYGKKAANAPKGIDDIPEYRPPDLSDDEGQQPTPPPEPYQHALDELPPPSPPTAVMVSNPEGKVTGFPQLDLSELDDIEKTLDDMMKKY